MIRFDPERVRANVRQATTEDLLDRATVYRGGMEEEALEMIEGELRSRGVDARQIEAHAAERSSTILLLSDGTATPCSFCDRPAVTQAWGWHRLWGLVPLFPRFYSYCDKHEPPRRD
jgi:hypothetical protein